MNRSLFFASATIALLAAACGKPGASSSSPAGSATVTSAAMPKGGSCNEVKAGICTEYGDNPLGIAESACKEMFAGSYAKAGCSTENLIGFCTKDKGGDKQFYYFGNGVAPWVEDAKKDCEQNPLTPGKFTAATTANVEQLAKDKAIPGADRIAGSCAHKDGSCDDVVGRMADLEKQLCEDMGGKYGTTACSADALVGSCVKHGKVARYYTSNLKSLTVKLMQQDCEDSISGGHWYPGPAAPAAKGAAAKPGAVKAAKPKK